MSAVEEVRDLLGEVLPDDVIEGFGEDESLFERQIVDSLRLVELITRLEARFGLVVEAEELVPEHFGSVAAIARFVRSKKQVT